MENEKYIRFCKDCLGCHSYFGFKNDKQYTEAYDSLLELFEDYPEFLNTKIINCM